MKQFAILIIIFSVLVLLVSVVNAIPNPAPVYCTEMGYTVAGDNCDFGDGNKCEQWAFYRGECGQEYVKNLTCAESGGELKPGSQCCQGLVSISKSLYSPGQQVGNFQSEPRCAFMVGAWSVCAPCGNGTCDEQWENPCNCPQDCGEKCPEICPMSSSPLCLKGRLIDQGKDKCGCTLPSLCCGNEVCEGIENNQNCPEDCTVGYKCAKDGEKVYRDERFGSTVCCSKNAGIKKPSSFGEDGNCVAPTDGSLGTCVEFWWRTCGDGKCEKEKGENKCSCPKDCKLTVETEQFVETEIIREGEKKSVPISIQSSSEGKVTIRTEKTEVETSEKVIIEDSKLYMKTDGEEKSEIKILPEEASLRAAEATGKTQVEVEKIELKQERERAVYSVRVMKKAKLFFVIPITMRVETRISAENGDVISVDKPWWSFFVR